MALTYGLSEDVASFADHYGGDVRFVRLAVTPEQAALYKLPAAPPKPTDRRRFDGDETWQAEALDPRDLADIVRGAIEKRVDRAAYARILEDEAVARLAVLDRLGGSLRPVCFQCRRGLPRTAPITSAIPDGKITQSSVILALVFVIGLIAGTHVPSTAYLFFSRDICAGVPNWKWTIVVGPLRNV
jgi:hypothetical protein